MSAVSLLGMAGALAWQQSEAGLSVTLPAVPPDCGHAYVLKFALTAP